MISHGSISSSRSGTRSRWTSTPASPPAISASEEASPAAPQSCSDSTSPRLDELERGLDQLLAGERVADLNGRPLLGRAFAKLLAREHGGAADPVAAGGGAIQEDQVSGAEGARSQDANAWEQAYTHSVDEAVARVGPVEDRLAADGRHADAVAVVADARDRAPEAPVGLAEAQAVEQRHWSRAHRDDVAQNPADPGGGALERLDRARVVVALDLERDRLALAEVDHTRVLAGPLQHALARAREALQAGAPSACSRSAPTRAARRPPARSGSARARAAHRSGRTRSW